MNMYDSIAANYERIFPLEKEKTAFVQSFFAPGARVFDAGCATGELAFELCKAGYKTVGVDLNTAMIVRAQKAAKEAVRRFCAEQAPEFYTADMRSLSTFGIFDAVLCFGNTLVHLENKDEVSAFFSSVYKNLACGGTFIFQILNYDIILAEQKVDFKTIETADFIFKRKYEFPSGEKIGFVIEFTDKLRNRTFCERTLLLPLKQKEIYDFLKSTGFADMHAYSDFRRTKSDMREFATIYTAQK
ncbi:class I SAM-dependent methyltransferase [Treponema sp. OMZ 840]|uniref:class I SAM-dependent methyltransferase n=1 Tax=Treponema sp. OMZ 840 TaxID=244313 RepID=UPI003D93DA5F